MLTPSTLPRRWHRHHLREKYLLWCGWCLGCRYWRRALLRDILEDIKALSSVSLEQLCRHLNMLTCLVLPVSGRSRGERSGIVKISIWLLYVADGGGVRRLCRQIRSRRRETGTYRVQDRQSWGNLHLA